MSAAVAAGNAARSEPNTEYSIVPSSDTRNVATLATQKTGHGDAGRAAVAAGAAAMVAGADVADIMALLRVVAIGARITPPVADSSAWPRSARA